MKKIYIILTILLCSIVSFGQMTFPFEENFDTYTVDEPFVNQVSATTTVWTTWSDAPGGTEDPIISDDQAVSGSNSIKVTSGNDLVLKTGDVTEDVYSASFNMYVPTGTKGYYNMLQEFSGGGGKWAYEANFNADGGVFSGPTAGTFDFDFDTWFEMKTIIDLDADWCEVFYNNTLVYEFQWSLGTSNTNLKQFAAINFYGADADGNDYYFDDVLIKTIAAAEPPTNVTATIEDGNDVVLTWEAPTSSTPDAYAIFRDGALIDTIMNDLTYTDTNLAVGNYNYFVRSYYSETGAYSMPDTIEVEIVTSINQNMANTILLYPNPVNNVLYVKGVEVADKIEVRSITGKLIYSGTDVSIFKNGYNTSDLVPGVYTVIIYNDNRAKALRFVK